MSAESPNPGTDLPRLPRGRHRLPFQYVAENQRRRLLAGAGRALAAHGYADLTVRHVHEEAGVSRTTFYANFDDKHDCILAAHRDAFERLVALILSACASEREWSQKVARAIAASLAFMAGEPGIAALLILNAVATDGAVARQVIESNAQLAVLLREGRRCTPLGPSLPDLIEDALVGGIGGIVGARVLNGATASLSDLRPELVELVLTPYVGVEEARSVATGA